MGLPQWYEVIDELGSGSFANVYRCRHTQLDRVVAIKVLKSERGHARALREVRLLAKLEHPNIVQIFDAGLTEDQRVFMALELLEGETLGQRIRAGGAMPTEEAAYAMDGLLAALSAAHAQGVIHRDLKPANVLLAQGPSDVSVKLLDFGIAHAAEMDRLTAHGMRVGTPRYMAPEAIAGGTPSPQSDIWSAGIILYEALSGRNAYPGGSANAIRAIASGPPPRIAELLPELSPLVASIVDTALEINPARRFTSADAFRVALAQATGRRRMSETTHMQFALGALDLSEELEDPQMSRSPGSWEPSTQEPASLVAAMSTPPPAAAMSTPPPAAAMSTPPPAAAMSTPPPAAAMSTPPPAAAMSTPPPAAAMSTPPPAAAMSASSPDVAPTRARWPYGVVALVALAGAGIAAWAMSPSDAVRPTVPMPVAVVPTVVGSALGEEARQVGADPVPLRGSGPPANGPGAEAGASEDLPREVEPPVGVAAMSEGAPAEAETPTAPTTRHIRDCGFTSGSSRADHNAAFSWLDRQLHGRPVSCAGDISTIFVTLENARVVRANRARDAAQTEPCLRSVVRRATEPLGNGFIMFQCSVR